MFDLSQTNRIDARNKCLLRIKNSKEQTLYLQSKVSQNV